MSYTKYEKYRKITSLLVIFTMLFSILSPLKEAFAVAGPSFTTTEIVPNFTGSIFPANITLTGGMDPVSATGTLTISGVEQIDSYDYFLISPTTIPADAVCFFFDITGTGTDLSQTSAECQGTGSGIHVDISTMTSSGQESDVASSLNNLINTNPSLGTLLTSTDNLDGTLTLSQNTYGTGGNIPVDSTYLFAFNGGSATNSITNFAGGDDGFSSSTNLPITAGISADSADHSITIDGVVIDLGIIAQTPTEIATTIASADYSSKDYTVTSSGPDVTFTRNIPGVIGDGTLTIDDGLYGVMNQVVDFTPAFGLEIPGYTYRVTINGNNYDYLLASGDTEADTINALHPLVDADIDVTCTIPVTGTLRCIADVAGTAFTYSTDILDITNPNATVTSTGTVTLLNSSAYAITGTGSENLLNVNIEFSGSLTASAVTSIGGISFTGIVDLSSFDDGLIAYSVTPVDLAGNTGATIDGTVQKYTILGGSISTASGSFIYNTGSIDLIGLDIGATYGLYSGTTLVSAGMLSATGSTGSLSLNPSFFTNFGEHELTLSGASISHPEVFSTNLDSKTYFIGPVDYAVLYSTIGTILAGSGITTNLNTVTNSTVTNFPGLYFKYSTGGIDQGQILFGTGLDLTSSNTQTFLQNLPNYLDMDNGYVKLTASGSDFKNYPSVIYMYNIPSGVPLSGMDYSNFVVKDDNDDIVNGSGIIDNVLGACGVGTGCTLFFDALHFTSYMFKPIVTLNGSGSVTTNFGSIYIDEGATYLDKDGTGSVTASGTVDTMTLGTYTLTYTRTDSAGNVSDTETRLVEVVATPITGSGTIAGPADLTGSTIGTGSSLDTSSLVLYINSTGSDLGTLSGTLMLSGVNLITASGGTWNGVLLPPTSISSGSTNNATLGELGSLVPQDTSTIDYTNTILETIQAGGESGVSLVASGSNFQVSVLVASGTAGDILKIFRSSNGTSWVANSPDATCTLTSSKMCVFLTNHLSFFSTVKTTSTPISGGNGGGSSTPSKDYCINGDYTSSYYDGSCGVSGSGTIVNEVSKLDTGTSGSGNILDDVNGTGNVLDDVTGTGNVLDLADISFPDIEDSFAIDDIKILAKNKIIVGYSDGTFRPNAGATRAEFLAMVIKSLGISVNENSTTEFTDIPAEGTWMIKYIAKAKELGIANGQIIDGKLKFRPNDGITRAEAIAILLNAAKILTSEDSTTEFSDIPTEGTWMIKYIVKAKELGIANGQIIDGKLKFRPNDGITRAETSRIIIKTLVYLKSIK